MQIIEKIKQFTKPLQGRLLPSNVGLFIMIFLFLNILFNIFKEYIENVFIMWCAGKIYLLKNINYLWVDIFLFFIFVLLLMLVYNLIYKKYILSNTTIYLIWIALLFDWHFYNKMETLALPFSSAVYLGGKSINYVSVFSNLFKFLYFIYLFFIKKIKIKYLYYFDCYFWVYFLFIWFCFGLQYAGLTYAIIGGIVYLASVFSSVQFAVVWLCSVVWAAAIFSLVIPYMGAFSIYNWGVSFICVFYYCFMNLPFFENQKEFLFAEDKLNQEDADSLGRKMIADSLVDKLIAQEFSESFTVGIIGEWGAGKSQFMSYMRDKIKQNGEIICFDFSPWTQIHKDKLVVGKHFFEEFGKAYRPYSSALDRELKAFQEKLIDKAPDFHWTGWIVQFFKHIGLGEWFQLDIDRNQINESLQKINRKTVIFIDDFDRLQVEEVVEVLKVIRTTTNFWNTVYIIGVDKTKLESPLRDRLHLPANYLDKFIQLEVHLTLIENSTLWDEFKNLFVPFLQKNKLLNYEEYLIYLSADDIFIDFFGKAMGNIRGVKRFFNMLSFDVSSWDLMELELDFFDFLLLSVVKFIDISEYYRIQVSEVKVLENNILHGTTTHEKGLLDFIVRHKNNKESKFYVIASKWQTRMEQRLRRSICVMKDAYFYEPSILKAIKKDVKEIFTPNKFGRVLANLMQFNNKKQKQIFDNILKIKAFKFVNPNIADFLYLYDYIFKWEYPFWSVREGNDATLVQLTDEDGLKCYVDYWEYMMLDNTNKRYQFLYGAVVLVSGVTNSTIESVMLEKIKIIEYLLSNIDKMTVTDINNLIEVIDYFFYYTFKEWGRIEQKTRGHFFDKIITFFKTYNYPNFFKYADGGRVFKFPAYLRAIAKHKRVTPFSLLEEMLNERNIQDVFYQNIQELKQFYPDIINDTWVNEKPYKL